MDSSEEQLPMLLAKDFNANFERLLLAYQDRLYSFVLSRTHSSIEAEEIVLTAFERAYYALRTYPAWRIEILKLEPWLFEITRNVFYNSIRDSRTRQANLPSISLDVTTKSAFFAFTSIARTAWLEYDAFSKQWTACFNSSHVGGY